MLAQVETRVGRPATWLADGGFVAHGAIDEATARGVCVLAPVPRRPGYRRDGRGGAAETEEEVNGHRGPSPSVSTRMRGPIARESRGLQSWGCLRIT